MSKEETKTTRTRRANARHKDVIFGAIDERLANMLEGPVSESVSVRHIDRLRELLDELRRSISKEGE